MNTNTKLFFICWEKDKQKKPKLLFGQGGAPWCVSKKSKLCKGGHEFKSPLIFLFLYVQSWNTWIW